MKVQTAIIKLKLWKSKVLADGTSPIVLCIRYNGQKIKSTGYSVRPNQWNESTETIKKSYPNSAAINEVITKIKTDAINRKLEFERKEIPYTVDMLMQEMPSNSTSLPSVIESMVESRKLSYKRSCSLYTALRSSGFESTAELTNENIINWTKRLVSDGIAKNTIFNYVSTILALSQFCLEEDLISVYPIKARAYLKSHIHREIHHRTITEADLNKLRDLWQDMYGKGEDVFSIHSKGFSLTIFLISVDFFGLAPVDLLNLKKEQFSVVEIKGCEYYQIDTIRRKTKKPLRIIVNKFINSRMIEPLLKAEGDYFIPVLDGSEDEIQMTKKIRNINEVVNRNLKTIFKSLGIKSNTWYSARHSWASIQASNGTPLGLIAQAMGRSVVGIDCYVKSLGTDEQLANLGL